MKCSEVLRCVAKEEVARHSWMSPSTMLFNVSLDLNRRA